MDNLFFPGVLWRALQNPFGHPEFNSGSSFLGSQQDLEIPDQACLRKSFGRQVRNDGITGFFFTRAKGPPLARHPEAPLLLICCTA
ncbi:MAG: hypothetical protein RI575_04550 [Balneolaceae bacterium]|nr:hypothetical protein [Balneolaceae bacterium]MDR9407909.1 hypothetical protein [Balneolaceae bacterium]